MFVLYFSGILRIIIIAMFRSCPLAIFVLKKSKRKKKSEVNINENEVNIDQNEANIDQNEVNIDQNEANIDANEVKDDFK